MNDSGDITKNCQEDVDEKVGTTATLKGPVSIAHDQSARNTGILTSRKTPRGGRSTARIILQISLEEKSAYDLRQLESRLPKPSSSCPAAATRIVGFLPCSERHSGRLVLIVLKEWFWIEYIGVGKGMMGVEKRERKEASRDRGMQLLKCGRVVGNTNDVCSSNRR